MNSHNNAGLTPRGREQRVRLVVDDGHAIAAVARRFKLSTRTVANGWAASAISASRGTRPLLQAAFIAEPNPACHVRNRRNDAPSALHAGRHRCRTQLVTGHRQPDPQTAGPELAIVTGTD